ncbi:sensor histidine kinase [Streptomyces venezuelae]|uniref:histidine kinase n=1 Tax=Streptomyces venezuelae TaxID=54571 RepID=A0A5P2CV77_STRVZ|nr:sensor histidine kinase [Streptomyces venezuelae]QES46812.1 sensor histidine kinase [Streptomyces venezuelae]
MGTRAERLTWSRNDALVAVGAAAVDLTGFTLDTQFDGVPLGIAAAFLVVASSLALLARRRHPVATLSAVLLLGVMVNLSAQVSPHFGLTPAIALYSVAVACRTSVVVGAALVTAPLNSLGQGGLPFDSGFGLLANTGAALLVVTTGHVVRRWQRETEATRALLAERAVAEERRRIARELHDIVAHHITTMQLMAGGARANLGHDPEAARGALVTLEGSGRLALSEMRQLLDVLRAGEEPETVPPAPQPGPGDLERIVTESRLAGMDTEFSVSGPPRPLPPTVGLTVFRIVQEALTNARKHAGNAPARVSLTYRPDEVAVEVRNECPRDGAGRRTPARRGGYGLIGMRERVALHGGTLEAAPREDGGFLVAARLPVPAAPDAAEDLRQPLPPRHPLHPSREELRR